MPRFFFHLVDGEALIEDVEGQICADDGAAIAHALVEARCIIASEIQDSGRLILDPLLSIDAEDGRSIARVHFSQAVIRS